MNIEKIRKICKPIKIVGGACAVGYALYSGNAIFYLGAIPLIAGLTNFCPPCLLSKNCKI